MTIPDAKPRLMARLRDDPPIILLEGEEMTEKACLNVTSQMGPEWTIWREFPASHRHALNAGEERPTAEPAMAEAE